MTTHCSHSTIKNGFTVIELLVVLTLIGGLCAIVTPAVLHGLDVARTSQCASNLRQLYLANQLYATDNGHYVPAAADLHRSRGTRVMNTKRWHGERKTNRGAFDASKSPLRPYLGTDKRVRACSAFKKYTSSGTNAFEASCGGYGYNIRGVGSQAYKYGDNSRGDKRGMPPGAIKNPAQTVMFTDAAFIKSGQLIEYSFAESYRFLRGDAGGHESSIASPSIHFRHNGKANVVWCDGHTTAEKMTVEGGSEFTEQHIGWFGEKNNELFDPY